MGKKNNPFFLKFLSYIPLFCAIQIDITTATARRITKTCDPGPGSWSQDQSVPLHDGPGARERYNLSDSNPFKIKEHKMI